jgi:hypothetical protein
MRNVLPLVIAGLATITVPAAAQDWQTVTTSRQLHGEEEFTASVKFLSGTLRVFPADNRTLYKAQMRYDAEQFQPINRFSTGSSRLAVGLEADDYKGDLDLDEHSPQFLDLELPLAIPTDLRLEFGVVSADIELGGVAISRVSVQTGASETSMRFSTANNTDCSLIDVKAVGARLELEGLGNSRCQRVEVAGGAGDITLDFTGSWLEGAHMQVEAKIGLGQLTLVIPQDLGVLVDLDRFLVSFDKAGFIQRGSDRSQWYSPNFGDASAQIEISIDAAIGDVDVVWVKSGTSF